MAKPSEPRHPQVEALREGRRVRSSRFASPKQYKRKPKHTTTTQEKDD